MTCHLGLGNRLFYFAHCIALAEATGHNVISLNIPEAGEYFDGRHGAFCVWPKSSALAFPWPRPVRRVVEAVYRRYFDAVWQRLFRPLIFEASIHETCRISLDNEAFLDQVRSHRLVVMRGWLAIEEIRLPDPESIRRFFQAPPRLAERCRDHARRARGPADILIGVHCRWGDYSWYGEGCFYYPVERYAQVMRHCAELFPGRRVAFLIVSNEPGRIERERAALDGLDFILGPNFVAEDLFTLAECDYIICPASSFSLWAAFQGRKPLWCMADTESLPSLDDFKIYETTFQGTHPEGELQTEEGRAKRAVLFGDRTP